MNKLMCILLATSAMGQAAFAAIEASQVKDARSFAIVLEANQKIQAYITGNAQASPELFVEILKFVEAVDTRQEGLNPKATEMLLLAEEIGNQLTKLDSKTRKELQPIMLSLLAQYPVRSKNEIVLRIFDRFWFWSTDNLDFLASKVRNDSPNLISTQLLWVFTIATREQRQKFFSQVPDRQPNPSLRWFHYALAYKYGRPIDIRVMKRLLNAVNPERIRPVPVPMVLNGVALPTTLDLYLETKARMRGDIPQENCSDLLVVDSN
ncbi:MAG: hypothetical protein ACXVA9_12915 [Bdellovibrionales bacterium]